MADKWVNISNIPSEIRHKKHYVSDFLGNPVIRTLCFHCRRHGFDFRSGN